MSTHTQIHNVKALHVGAMVFQGRADGTGVYHRDLTIQTDEGRTVLTLYGNWPCEIRLPGDPDAVEVDAYRVEDTATAWKVTTFKKKLSDPDAVFPAAADLPTEDQTPTTPLTPSA